LCYQCARVQAGKPSTEQHHVGGRAQLPLFEVPQPANKHRVLSDYGKEWPPIARRHPVAGLISGALDFLRLEAEDAVPESRLRGPHWWTVFMAELIARGDESYPALQTGTATYVLVPPQALPVLRTIFAPVLPEDPTTQDVRLQFLGRALANGVLGMATTPFSIVTATPPLVGVGDLDVLVLDFSTLKSRQERGALTTSGRGFLRQMLADLFSADRAIFHR
jgi:hypothetical protein